LLIQCIQIGEPKANGKVDIVYKIDLYKGDLFILGPLTNAKYQHRILQEKDKKAIGSRISIIYRAIKTMLDPAVIQKKAKQAEKSAKRSAEKKKQRHEEAKNKQAKKEAKRQEKKEKEKEQDVDDDEGGGDSAAEEYVNVSKGRKRKRSTKSAVSADKGKRKKKTKVAV
jgi:hypothetical protein